MKFYIYTILFSLLLLALPLSVIRAQDTEELEKNRPSVWSHIRPDNVKIQFAGNIGMFSGGLGYTSPNNHWKGDLLYGFVPRKYSADKPLHLLTLKGKYGAIDRTYWDRIRVQWLNLGMWTNYTFGEQYFVKLPDHYPNNYYLIRPGLNIGAFAGSEIRYKQVGAYYEIGTTEKHLIHFFKNIKAISPTYIFNTAIGIVYYLD